MSFKLTRFSNNEAEVQATIDRVTALLARHNPVFSAKEILTAWSNGTVLIENSGDLHTLGAAVMGWNWVMQKTTATLLVAVGDDVDGLVEFASQAAAILGAAEMHIDPRIVLTRPPSRPHQHITVTAVDLR